MIQMGNWLNMFYKMNYTRKVYTQMFFDGDKNKPIYKENIIGVNQNDHRYIELVSNNEKKNVDMYKSLIASWNKGNHGFKYELKSVEIVELRNIQDDEGILIGDRLETLVKAIDLK